MIDHEQKFIDIHPIFFNYAKKVAEEMNRVFGWSVTVEYGETVKKENEVIDSNVKQEIAEVENVSRETNPNDNDNDDKTDGENND